MNTRNSNLLFNILRPITSNFSSDYNTWSLEMFAIIQYVFHFRMLDRTEMRNVYDQVKEF
jgi:hypothetical protein